METNRTGDIAEIKACAWLLERGCEVFRNVAATGPVDVVAIKNGSVYLFDVKSKNGSLTPKQAAMGVSLLIQNGDGGFRIEGAAERAWRYPEVRLRALEDAMAKEIA